MADEKIIRIMEEHGLDEDDAVEVQELIEEEGVDEDDAVEIVENS